MAAGPAGLYIRRPPRSVRSPRTSPVPFFSPMSWSPTVPAKPEIFARHGVEVDRPTLAKLGRPRLLVAGATEEQVFNGGSGLLLTDSGGATLGVNARRRGQRRRRRSQQHQRARYGRCPLQANARAQVVSERSSKSAGLRGTYPTRRVGSQRRPLRPDLLHFPNCSGYRSGLLQPA